MSNFNLKLFCNNLNSDVNTKKKILVTATKVFNERGYGAVNLKELAEVVGISRGNLTYHFKTKEEAIKVLSKIRRTYKMWNDSFLTVHTKTVNR